MKTICFRQISLSGSFLAFMSLGSLRSSLPSSLLSSLLSFMPLAAILLITSCTTDFDPEIDDTPLPVLNVMVANDSVISAYVSRSWQFDTDMKRKDVVIADAQVEYSVNDGEWETMRYDETGLRYLSDRIAREGDRVSVRASTRYGKAEGRGEVPRVVPIDKVEYTMERRVDNGSMLVLPDGSITHPVQLTFRYRLTFTDPGGEDNYYLVSGDAYVDDPIISDNESAIDGVLNKYHYCSFFSDSSISGGTYTLSLFTVYHVFPFISDFYANGDTIRLVSISRDYYFYILSLFKKYTGLNGILEDFGVADPRSVFSNVSSGAGIVGAKSVSEYHNDVKPIIQEIRDEIYH